MIVIRILMVHPGPDFSVADVFNGWKKAFTKMGHEVGTYTTNERLSFYGQIMLPDFKGPVRPSTGEHFWKRAMDNDSAVAASMQGLTHELFVSWPHLIFFVSGFFVPAWLLDTIRSRRMRIVILHTESPYQDDEQLMRAQYAHLNLLNDPVNLEEYAQIAPAMYMPHAYDPDVHYPGEGNEDIDFSFIGTMFDSRREFFEGFIRKFDDDELKSMKIAMGGSGWDGHHLDGSPLLSMLGHDRSHSVDNTETADIYRRTKVGMNFYRRESEDNHVGEGWAMGPREVELAACGVPFIRDSRPESDEVFGDILPSVHTTWEAAELLRMYLRDETARRAAGQRAREAIKDRTFDNHATFLMHQMEEAGIV